MSVTKKVSGRLFYSGFYSFAASVISIILSLGITVLTARLLGPGGKGSYDLVLVTTNLLATVFGLSLPSGITYIVASEPTAIRRLTKTLFIFALSQGILAVGLLSLLDQINYSQWFLPKLSDNSHFIIVIGLSLVFTALNSYWRAIFIGYQEIIKVNKLDLIGKFINPLVLSVSAIILTRMSYDISPIICIWINLFALISTSVILFKDLNTGMSTSATSSNISKIILYSAPCYLGNLFQFLNYKLDVFLVANFTTNIAEVGFYTLAASIAQLIWLLPNSAATIIFPKIAAEKNLNQDDTDKSTAMTARLFFWISLLIGGLIALFLPLVVPIVYGESFMGIIPAFILLLPGVISLSGATILTAYIAGMGKPNVNLILSFIGFIITMIFDFMLIPHWSIRGAAIASSLSYIVITIGAIIAFVKISNNSWIDTILLKNQDIKILFSLIKKNANFLK